MNYYFGSVPPTSLEGQWILENSGCVLHSQYRERNLISQWIKLRHETEYSPRIFVDSGAYSAHTMGVDINIDDYIKYLNTIIDDIELCAALDVIGDAEKSWENYLYMRERVSQPNKVLYTFHFEEDFKYLERAVEYFIDNNILYMAIGGVALIKNPAQRVWFLDEVQNRLKGTNIKIHLFGVTDYKVVSQIKCESVDSTQHIMAGAFGKIILPKGDGFKVLRPDKIKGTPDEKDLTNVFKSHNVTIDELIDSRNSRVYFNTQILSENINSFICSDKTVASKTDLW